MSTAQDRRARRTEQRREEILAAAAQAFAAKGYHNATTREIAEAADVAEGTIFNYFPSKRELLVAVFEQGAERMREMVLRLDPGVPARPALTGLVEAVLSFYVDHRLHARAILAEAWTDPELMREHALSRVQRIAGALRRYFEVQISAGRLRPFDTELVVRLILGMTAALVLPFVCGAQPLPSMEERRRLAQSVVDLVLDGIGPAGEA